MKARCVLVLGMHNSGTSLLGSLLHAIGAPMGPSLLQRDQIPEEKRPAYDYFEDKDVVELQDKVLAKLDRHWSSYKASWPLRDATEDPSFSSHIREFESRLAALVESRLSFGQSNTDAPLWIVKDPRTPILLEGWLRVMEWLEIEPIFIVVHRDAAANIQSFSNKGQVPVRWSEALWQRTYVQIGKQISAAASTHILNFNDLLVKPLDVAQQLQNLLGIYSDTPLEQLLNNVVDQTLPSKHPHFELTAISEYIQRCLQEGLLSKIPNSEDPALEANQMQADLSPCTQLTLSDLELNIYEHTTTNHFCRKRICLLTAELQGYGSSGGIGTAMYELALELISAGHNLEVWLIGGEEVKPSTRINGIHVRYFSGEVPANEQIMFRQQLAKTILTENFDIVHCHDWLGLGACLHSQPFEGVRPTVICGLHGPTQWVREGSPFPAEIDADQTAEQKTNESCIVELEWEAIVHADFLVSPSLYMSNWVSTILAKRRIYPYIHVQLNCPSVSTKLESSSNCLSRSLPNPSPDSLVFFGRLEERKGIRLFLKALSILGPQPSPVYFIGSDAPLDGGLASELLERFLQEIGQSYYWLSDLTRDQAHEVLHSLGGIVVVPSLIENSPYTVQELLDTSMRLVTTDVGGIPELVEDRKQSLCSPNPQDLANNIQQALDEKGVSASNFKLASRYSHSRICLSWQAFHARLPLRTRPMPRWDTKEAIILITLDSCRLDTFESSFTPSISKVGPLHKAKSPSYFTYASHAAMFMGFLPSISEAIAFVNSKFAKVFRLSQAAFQAVRAKEGFELSGNSIITGLKRKGYFTIGTGSVNWFDPETETGRELVRDFEEFWFAGNTWSLTHQLKWIDSQLARELERPPLIFLNIGETHVPYWHQGAQWSKEDNPCLPFQKQDRRRDCQERQRACLEFVDKQLAPLLERFNDGTVIICSDHGDCWGEDGIWEHGVSHEKTLAVPLLMRICGSPVEAPLSFRERISRVARNKLFTLLSRDKLL